jgi:hypothetical protein
MRRWNVGILAMKPAVLAFLALLLYAHDTTGDPDRLVHQPLSMFRDGERWWLGYAMFAVLLLIGCLYTRALARAGGREAETLITALAALLLLVVAATPSWEGFHLLCSLLLFALLFGYFAVLLHKAESPFLFAHLGVPFALALMTGWMSYGLWQKGFVAYLLLVTMAHHHSLVRQAGGQPTRRPARRDQRLRRRKVYQVELGREWARRDVVLRTDSS